MGVTINFEGTLRDEAAVDQAVGVAEAFAAQEGWRAEIISKPARTLNRSRGMQFFVYTGPVRGVVLYPHEWAEPFRLEVDRDLFVQNFIKTQYAPVEIHLKVIDLLRALAPHFADLSVHDEGEYWETANMDVLQGHRRMTESVMGLLQGQQSGIEGPVRLPNRRIADFANSHARSSGRRDNSPFWRRVVAALRPRH
jgi:hypothetical protein